MALSRCASLVALALILPIASCASDGTTKSTNSAYSAAPAKMTGEILCPVCGTVVTTSSPSAQYGVYAVYCCSVADARQFASLPAKKRAELAAPQVLQQKRITNATCPLTGEKLTAAAAPVLYEGEIIGFASQIDANQFNSLPAKKKKECVDTWKATATAPSAG